MRRAALIAALLATAPHVARAQLPRGTAAGRVQMGVSVQPETVTVGDPFRVAVRVRAPRGSSISFPVGPDTTVAQVEALDQRAVTPGPDSTVVEQTALYKMVAWDTGAVATGLADVTVTGAAAQTLSLGGVRVYVRSVLPRDSALRVPKPARDILVEPHFPWLWVIGALVATALLALLIWWFWRRRRRRAESRPSLDPFEHAEHEFARIERLALLDAGERGRYVALAVEVLRDYAAARLEGAPTSFTSTELLGALRGRAAVPIARLAAVLAEADLVKFARRPVTAERARELAGEAHGIVRDVEQALRAEQAARADADAAREAA